MQSKSQTFPISHFIAVAMLLFIGALLWSVTSAARAQTVAGYSSGPAIENFVSKAAGQAEIAITGVQLNSNLSYCLIGLGHGNWHGTAAKVNIEKVGCAKIVGDKVTVPIRLEAKRYESKGAVIGYIPIGVDADGVIKVWPDKPSGSVEFIRANGQPDRAIPIRWSVDGKAVLITADQANGQFSD